MLIGTLPFGWQSAGDSSKQFEKRGPDPLHLPTPLPRFHLYYNSPNSKPKPLVVNLLDLAVATQHHMLIYPASQPVKETYNVNIFHPFGCA